MEKAVLDYVTSLVLGETQSYQNLAVVPLFSQVKGDPAYVTMKEALEGGFMLVTEVGEGGTVPELKVKNSGDKAALLLDGEEVSSAKQRGLLVIINGEVVGMDMLSLLPAYEVLHPKLLKSYALEAALNRQRKTPRPARKRRGPSSLPSKTARRRSTAPWAWAGTTASREPRWFSAALSQEGYPHDVL